MMIPSKSFGIVTLYFFLILLHTFASPTFHYCRHDQRDALLEFKHEFNKSDPNLYGAFLSSWNKSSDCCFWEGVTCDSKYGEVTSLFFDTISLNNSLKPNSSLFKLQHLRNLTLRNCNLYGEIPSSLTNLSRLSLLDLSYNYLLGQVPHSIGNLSHLIILDLCNNNLVGQVPSSLGNLTQLRFMILSYNKLSGKIPISFANLTKLYELNLKSNYLESTLPPDMSRFHNLEYFDVSQNSLTGPFPTSLFTIPSLISIDLELNHFMGPIEFGNMSSSSSSFRLQYINLAQNKFYGPIPESISQYLNLVELHLSFNNLNGLIPRSLSNLVKLEYFCLTNNKLQGQVPSWLWRLTMVALSNNSFNSFGKSSENLDETQVKWLDLSSNSFQEPFPIWICKLRSLEILILSNNLFNGSVPPCLKNSTASLTDLILRNNSLSGVLPDIFVNATKLLSLDVSRNHLEGQLPRSLIHCTRLELVNVRSNKLKDKFPHWLGSLSSLHVLILRSNMFYGTLYHHHHHHESIGFQSLRVIDISHNDFTGTLPSFYFTDWREMIRITEEDDNFIISDVPYMGKFLNATAFYISSMEIVSKGVEMEFKRINEDYKNIDFSRNNLFGDIPESIGLLKELRHLNLSGNAFTGNIPQSLSNLTKLEALDLSRNQLSGQIPRDLGSLSFMSTMNFSHNFLEGPVPRSTQFLGQSCSSFKDNPKLYDLEDICGETHVPNPVLQDSDDLSEEEEEQVINWLSAAITYVPGVFCGFVIGHIFISHKHIKKFHRNKPKVFMQIAR